MRLEEIISFFITAFPGKRAVSPQSGQQPLGRAFTNTKMVLLGELWWHDEDEFGTADMIGFRPQRLWVASANGTASSRR
jgi:hypothetical protein